MVRDAMIPKQNMGWKLQLNDIHVRAPIESEAGNKIQTSTR